MLVHERLSRQFRALAMIGALLGMAGCDTSLGLLVGKKGGSSEPPAAPPTAVSPATTSFLSDSDLMPGFSAETVVPPTLSFESDQGGSAEPDAASSAGPHRAIAVAPLTPDSAALANLAKAATREPGSTAGRFVLLVLTPPATDAASLDRENAASRTGASAAVKALGDAGIAADRIEISLATNPEVGNGELRLYRR